MPDSSETLTARAAAHGVATWYENVDRQRVDVAPAIVEAVLDLLGPPPQEATAEPPPLRALPEPPRSWGWMLQLYGLRSADSWGVGDFADLAAFARWAAGTGAGAVLVNPLHAVAPVDPIPASPYSPTSRRFVNPLYLRVEDTAAYRDAEPALRAEVAALRPTATDGDLVDYATAWRAKRAALELLFDPAAVQPGDADVTDFATYTALAERHGPDWRTWPAELRRPDAPAVVAARTELADRIAFHVWLQRLCDEQLGAANAAAADMAVGIVYDLAVGIDPGGADAWMQQDVIAQGARIGAPPDEFNQQGQDWGLATWRPDRLAATGYAAYRELLRSIFSSDRAATSGGLRVDHVAGLWRLWWVPPGAAPGQGTYVHYDAATMLDVLVEEAGRAGAVVVGEDLGTVLPEVTEGLQARNMLGSAVLWFSRAEDGSFLPPEAYKPNAAASISTHDLPTAAGFLAGEHVLARAEAGALGRDVKEEWAAAGRERKRLLDLLDAEGLIEPDSTDEEIVFAMHRLLARTPCKLVLVSPYDVLGEVRQPNLPGTTDQYPNWRIPLPLTLEELVEDERVARVVSLMAQR